MTIRGPRKSDATRRIPLALRPELWIPAAYAAISVAWITLSDLLVGARVHSVAEQTGWSIVKGIGFVVVTSVALYAGVRWAFGRERRATRLTETSEAALRESEERFRAIFEQAAVGMAEVDVQTGRFLRVNDKLCDILGYSREELLMRGWQHLTHPTT